MPIRIKPLQKLDPCILTLESLQKITALIESSFPNASDTIAFSASDDIWEIYDERRDSFLNAISGRQKLDSFRVDVKSQGAVEQIEIVFDDKEAKVLCIADPQQANWFEHFMIDLKKCLLPSSFVQFLAYVYGQREITFNFRLLFLTIPYNNPVPKISAPYCKIVIQQRPPSPFIENIKANIASNIIWAIFVFIFGIISTIVIQQFLNK